MDSLTAFAAIGLTAVAWDGSLTPAGGRAFRHALDYREPYCSLDDQDMVDLMDWLLNRRREIGNNALMLEAAQALRIQTIHFENPQQLASDINSLGINL